MMTIKNRHRPRRRLPNVMVKNYVKGLSNSNRIFVEFIKYDTKLKKEYKKKNFEKKSLKNF